MRVIATRPEQLAVLMEFVKDIFCRTAVDFVAFCFVEDVVMLGYAAVIDGEGRHDVEHYSLPIPSRSFLACLKRCFIEITAHQIHSP